MKIKIKIIPKHNVDIGTKFVSLIGKKYVITGKEIFSDVVYWSLNNRLDLQISEESLLEGLKVGIFIIK
jgi:hypothetical protein